MSVVTTSDRQRALEANWAWWRISPLQIEINLFLLAELFCCPSFYSIGQSEALTNMYFYWYGFDFIPLDSPGDIFDFYVKQQGS